MMEVEKFRNYMEVYNLSEEKIAGLIGYPAHVVQEMLQPGKTLPRWLKLVLQVWERTEGHQRHMAV
ncbi:MAG: hypothetical protein AAF693_20445 [Bacteroidota bacterium]